MKQTSLRFTVEFQSDSSLSRLNSLVQAISGVTGVQNVESSAITVSCPVAKLHVLIGFEGAPQAERLYGELTRMITSYEGASLWSRECTLSELYE